MAGFLYFLPRQKGVTADDLRRVGLGPVLDGASFSVAEVIGKGPSGGPGALVTPTPVHPDGREAVAAFQPAEQAWHDAGKFHAGFWLNRPPAPPDLVRPRILDGYLVELQGGSQWAVPVARHHARGTALDTSVYLGPDGGLLEGDVLAEYADLAAHGDRVWDSFRAEQGLLDEGEAPPPELERAEAFKIAVEALGFNYRLGLAEASLLGMRGRFLTKVGVQAVLRCLFDLPAWLEAEAARQASAEGNAPAGTPSG